MGISPQESLRDVEQLTRDMHVDPKLYQAPNGGTDFELYRGIAPPMSRLKIPCIRTYVSLEAGRDHDPVAEVAIEQVAKPERGKPTMKIVGLHAEPGKAEKAVRQVVPRILSYLGAKDAVVDPKATNIPPTALEEAGLAEDNAGQYVIPAAA